MITNDINDDVIDAIDVFFRFNLMN